MLNTFSIVLPIFLLIGLGYISIKLGLVDADLPKAAIIISAAPMFAIYPVIGERFGYRSFCANTLLLATVAGFISMVVVLKLIGL